MEHSTKVEQAVQLGVAATQSPMAIVNLYGKFTLKPVAQMPTYL
jgi:hypothetical protein